MQHLLFVIHDRASLAPPAGLPNLSPRSSQAGQRALGRR